MNRRGFIKGALGAIAAVASGVAVAEPKRYTVTTKSETLALPHEFRWSGELLLPHTVENRKFISPGGKTITFRRPSPYNTQ